MLVDLRQVMLVLVGGKRESGWIGLVAIVAGFFLADQIVDHRLAQALFVEGRVHPTGDVELERGLLLQQLDQGGEAGLRGSVQHGRARRERHVAQVRVLAATDRGEQPERRGHGAHDQVAQRAPDQPGHAELRIVQRAGDRHVHVDLALGVLQQRHRQLHRQVARARRVAAIAEGQLVDEDVVVGRELAVVELVVHVDVEHAAGDRITGVAAGVGRQMGKLDAIGLCLDVEEGHRRNRIDAAADVHRRVFIELALDHQRRRRPFAGAEGADAAAQVGDVGGVVGLDEVVGVIELAAGKRDLADLDFRCRPERQRRCRRRRAGCDSRGRRFFRARHRHRGRAGLAGYHVLQVEPAAAVDDQAGIEIAQRQAADIGMRRTVAQPHDQSARGQRMPAQEIVAGEFVLHADTAQRGRAAIVDARVRMPAVAIAEAAIEAEQGTADAHVEGHADQRLQRGDVHPPGDDAQVGIQRLRRGFAVDGVTASAQPTCQAYGERLAHVRREIADAVALGVQRDRHGMLGRQVLERDVTVVDAELRHVPAPGRRYRRLSPGGRRLHGLCGSKQRKQVDATVAQARDAQFQSLHDDIGHFGLACRQIEAAKVGLHRFPRHRRVAGLAAMQGEVAD